MFKIYVTSLNNLFDGISLKHKHDIHNCMKGPTPKFINDETLTNTLQETHGSAYDNYPDSKVHGANMGPTWVLSAPDGPHVGPINFAIRVNNRNTYISRISYW